MDTFTKFLDSFFEQIALVKLDVTGLILDHIAYQASSAQDYESKKTEYSAIGKEVSEKIIGGRRVAIFELYAPIQYKEYKIGVLEIIEPREGQECASGLQHAEFIASQTFEDYIKMYPNISWDTSSMHREDFPHLKLNFENGLTLKFPHRGILEQIKMEEA